MPDSVLPSDRFPNLQHEGYTTESPATPTYNCVGWAVDDVTRWWWPHPLYYWPNGCPEEETVASFEAMFASLGFLECSSDALEPGYRKLALYALHGTPTHVARQETDGTWVSKLGGYLDIRHTLRGLEGTIYGQVVKYFKKARD